MVTIPPYLKKGDTIGLVCPAGYMPPENYMTCVETLKEWGFQVEIGKTPGHQYNYFSGTDDERCEDIQKMMDDKNIDAILCARGGYGVGRIIDKLDFKKFQKRPKWIVGYSDITVLHCHAYMNYKIATLHAPMAAAFNDGQKDNEYVRSVYDALTGKKANYYTEAHQLNIQGNCKGRLIGGNLALLTHLIGTDSDFSTKNKILFIEDVGEYIYNVDRMMIQLKRNGKLDGLKGLIIGRFSEMKDTTVPYGKSVEQVIHEIVKDADYPVCFNFPVGHQDENYALKVGCKYELQVASDGVRLKEE